MTKPTDWVGEVCLDPEATEAVLKEGVDRVSEALADLEEAQKTREEIFELFVSV